ncbi:hypothetical protein D3C87_2098280 [compost metagenome]
MLGLELLYFLKRPRVETIARFQALDPVARIYFGLANFDRPREHGADSLDDVVRSPR